MSELKSVFPEFKFPDSLDEEDLLWDPVKIESEEHLITRTRTVLQEIIDHSQSSRCECLFPFSIIIHQIDS